MKRILSLLLTVILTPQPLPGGRLRRPRAGPPTWPSRLTGASSWTPIPAPSFFGKNLHETYYPASITKVLTALIVLEHCSLDEEVTFSYDAVYNVESGSSNAGIDEGDVLTVRDCLYALLLQSANEAANALAEHVSGSREAFAELMNETAASLGCQDSHFANPSGLKRREPLHLRLRHGPDLPGGHPEPHVPGDRRRQVLRPAPHPELSGGIHGLRPSPAMLLPSRSQYYEGAFGGKTGYTSLAGNTLVTFATRNDMNPGGSGAERPSDPLLPTQRLCWIFGFANFHTAPHLPAGRPLFPPWTAISPSAESLWAISPTSPWRRGMITLPLSASHRGCGRVRDLPSWTGLAPENAIAQVQYTYNDRLIGSAYLLNRTGEEEEIPLIPLEVPRRRCLGPRDRSRRRRLGPRDRSRR